MRPLSIVLAFGLALALMPVAFADSSKPKAQMIVTFSIKDYAAWRPVFDAAAPKRALKGVSAGKVYRDADSANDLLVVFDIADKKNAKAWMTSATVRSDWEKGGVVGTPTYRFAN